MTHLIDKVVVKSPDILFSDVGEHTVMMNINSGEYFDLDVVGTEVWTLIDAKLTVAEICSTLTQKFDVSLSQCQQDVLVFLEELLKFDAITLKH